MAWWGRMTVQGVHFAAVKTAADDTEAQRLYSGGLLKPMGEKTLQLQQGQPQNRSKAAMDRLDSVCIASHL
eukprot:scaffold41995_cov18-Prasinocladus_malaysianus.AAC.3